MSDPYTPPGVSAEEWIAWLQRMDRKLGSFRENLDQPPLEEAGDIRARIANLEARVANIEGKLDISPAFEPN